MGDEEDSTRDDDNQFMRADPNEQYENEHDNGQEEVNTPEPNQDGKDAQNDQTNITFNDVSPADQAIIEKAISTNQFQNRAFQQTRTGDFKERIKNAIITAIPKDKLKGINRINMGIILSLSGHIELISVYQTKNMIKQWTAEDYYKMDKTLKEDMFYAPWKEPIPYCYFHESIQIAD